LGSDAWRGSIEIAIAKAYTAVAFSSNDLALDSRTVGLVTRPDGPGSTVPADIGTDAGVRRYGVSAPAIRFVPRSAFFRVATTILAATIME
jgi:hypothetical protein